MTLRADIETASAAKVSKSAAKYSGGMKSAHCAICRHFQSPDACEIVKGTINPQAWCKYFETKKRSA